MKKVLPFRIELGSTSLKAPKREILDFYSATLQLLFNKTANFIDTGLDVSIPISNTEMIDDPTKLYSSIVTYFQVKPPRELDTVIIDVSGPYKGTFRGQIFAHLSSAIRWMSDQFDKVSFIVLIDEILPAGDLFVVSLEALMKNGRLLILDDQGRVMPGDASLPADFETKYSILTNRLREDPLHLLKRKLVRRLGHFKWKNRNDQSYCSRYFYDGSKCVKQIAELLSREIVNLHACNTGSVEIVYHAPFSPWLSKSVSVVSENIGIHCYRFEEYIRKRGLARSGHLIVLVVDLITSGETVASLYRQLVKKVGNSEVSIVSILTSKMGNADRQIEIDIGESKVFARFLHQVESQRMLPENCPMCKLGMLESSIDDEDYDKFTSYDMWYMINQAGCIPEKDVPKHRELLSLVPDYTRMLINHGSLIAFKLERILDRHGLSPADLVLVCPLERFPEAFQLYLKDIMDVDAIIYIPRGDLEEIAQHYNDIESVVARIEGEKREWINRLKTTSQSNLVILDEFQVSGGSLRQMRAILEHFNKKIFCYLPIIDFNPRLTAQHDITTLSLYEMQRIWKNNS